MRRLLFLLLMLTSAAGWAAPRELTWPELIPVGAPPPPPPVPLHDLSKLSDVLNAESGPAVKQQTPNAPVVQALDGQEVKMPGYIVPLEVEEDGQTVRDAYTGKTAVVSGGKVQFDTRAPVALIALD